MDRLQMILDEVQKAKSKKGDIWYQDRVWNWRAYNEEGIIHIVLEEQP